ncbi:hypothetical protein EYF80_025279 [Liparis tanakae]|uniref:Uncharacterized protein n=1 Tax=Liparis tanakae TaxID=230148 RepID=A0A4Z2HFZ6_9TELE|nr:hypothetical protein EYF80_025279 [Liparis tanakae]
MGRMDVSLTDVWHSADITAASRRLLDVRKLASAMSWKRREAEKYHPNELQSHYQHSWSSAVTDLVQAVEQVAQAGPLQGRGRVEGVEAGGEGVVALLQHGLQQGQRLGQLSMPSDRIFFSRLRVFPTHSASLLDSSTTALSEPLPPETPTGDGEDLTDVDPEQAEAAGAHEAEPLQVQQGGRVLEALQPPQLLHAQDQGSLEFRCKETNQNQGLDEPAGEETLPCGGSYLYSS